MQSPRTDPSPEEEVSAVHKEPSIDHTWYKGAVFYEVLIRGFYDANDDGTGDIKGLTSKLDYLKWLGVDCLWLLPFCQSPLRDGGYDISDYYSVLPEYGTVEDMKELIDEVHKRDMRIIADIVMNHTSEEHPWFIESSSSKDNPKADWYVWSDDDQLYSDARIIFVDTEKSNWTWHPTRRQYYWHRFFSHQPDLNFDNPEVRQAMLDMSRYWMDLGLDGMRLDAVPFLYERPGTNGENLKETHDYLKFLRREIDASHPGRVLLAEANQQPHEVVEYFGDGDECHMAFNFPLMPRMYMSVRSEKRQPIIDALSLIPKIPDNCQWGMFLRNHDELTLEMVNDEERDYMYAEFAKDPRMRRNVGIGRRLLPLVENDRRVAELMHAMLLSLPGSPVMYYGDEIGMGDNIYLQDRDTVRTPMQWSPDRNAGFSRADWAQLYLQPLMDSVYGYHAINVESQQRNTASFLHWVKHMLDVRRQHPLFGTGSLELLPTENHAVLAYTRQEGDDVVMCVNNLSHVAQPVELDMGQYSGYVPVELLGRVSFPPIGELPYFVTLGPYQFYWFQLKKAPTAPTVPGSMRSASAGNAPGSGATVSGSPPSVTTNADNRNKG